MALPKLIEICKEAGLPTSPLAVTRLELNCQLFAQIGECISEYRGVQQLHLDRNRITRIENLGALVHLKCLYLQGNAIRSIGGLEGLRQLQLLNLSGNQISRLSGLDGLPRLQALLVADNHLSDGPSIDHLTRCTALAELDLGHNRLADAEGVLQVLAAMPSLQSLTLAHNPMSLSGTASAKQISTPAPAAASAAVTDDPAGNPAAAAPVAAVAGASGANTACAPASPAATEYPAASTSPPLAFYRRSVVARCQQLTALDHTAIFPQERRYAEAWWHETRHHQSHQTPRALPHESMAAAPLAVASGAAGGSAGASAAAQLDGARLPMDVLYPVLTRLDARTLVLAALSCRPWCSVATFPLARQRLTRAQAALCDASAAVPRLATTLTEVHRGELDELLATEPRGRPVVQLFYALEVLWRLHQLRNTRSRARTCMQQQRQHQQRSAAAAELRLADAQPQQLVEGPPPLAPSKASCEAEVHDEAIRSSGGSGTRLPFAGPSLARLGTADGSAGSEGPINLVTALSLQLVGPARELPREPAGNDGSRLGACPDSAGQGLVGMLPAPAADAVPSAVQDADPGLEQDLDEDLRMDPEPVDLDSQTWRTASWEAARQLLQDPAFPLPALPDTLPLGPRALAVLRCRTGSADDLDFYVPELRPQDVARHNPSAGRLAEWLLGVEAHCRAAHEVDTARRWTWPARVAARARAEATDGDSVVGSHGEPVHSRGADGGSWEGGGCGRGGGDGGWQGDCEGCSRDSAGGDSRGHGGVPLGVVPIVGPSGGSAGTDRGAQGASEKDGGGGCLWPSAVAAAVEMRDAIERIFAARNAEAEARAAAATEARAHAEAAAATAAMAAVAAAAPSARGQATHAEVLPGGGGAGGLRVEQDGAESLDMRASSSNADLSEGAVQEEEEQDGGAADEVLPTAAGGG